MARGGQAGGRVAGGDERSAGIPTRDAERGVKARGLELVDGAADGGVAPASSASSDAKARENLRRIGDVTRRLRHMRVGVPTRLGVGIEVLGMFTGSDMGEAAVD